MNLLGQDFESILAALADDGRDQWVDYLRGHLINVSESLHGDVPRWTRGLDVLNTYAPETACANLDQATVSVGADAAPAVTTEIVEALKLLHPWRKGPFRVHGVEINTEWRSDWKWARIEPHLAVLKDRRVLDIGCGNGYYLWRALGAGAKWALGVDPMHLFCMQFGLIQQAGGLSDSMAAVLPMTGEQLGATQGGFETVMSMGVLGHRRDPFGHLADLRNVLVPGGQLVLETLVVDGGHDTILVPDDRYARMRNVWFLPSPLALEAWLRRAGFKNVHTVDVTPTTIDEQRKTDWMTFDSLADALDPADATKTIEGLPAPVRAVVVAEG